jgi:hypothetical protein
LALNYPFEDVLGRFYHYIIKWVSPPDQLFSLISKKNKLKLSLNELKQTCLAVVKEAKPDPSQNPDLLVRDSSSP